MFSRHENRNEGTFAKTTLYEPPFCLPVIALRFAQFCRCDTPSCNLSFVEGTIVTMKNIRCCEMFHNKCRISEPKTSTNPRGHLRGPVRGYERHGVCPLSLSAWVSGWPIFGRTALLGRGRSLSSSRVLAENSSTLPVGLLKSTVLAAPVLPPVPGRNALKQSVKMQIWNWKSYFCESFQPLVADGSSNSISSSAMACGRTKLFLLGGGVEGASAHLDEKPLKICKFRLTSALSW